MEVIVADSSAIVEENVEGKWYVDDTCIACNSCVSIAPDHFVMTDDDSHAYVMKQPESGEEEELCQEASESCPVECIGADNE